MTVIASPESKNQITKLCASILTCMDNLKNCKADILLNNDINKLMSLFITFQKEEKLFVELQKKFAQVTDSQYSQELERLKQKFKNFYETFSPEEVQQKLQKMKQDKTRESAYKSTKKNEQLPYSQMQMSVQQNDLTRRILEQDQQQIKMLQSMMQSIKKMALDISGMIYEQGTNLKIAAEKMHRARKNIEEGKKQLLQANAYQQDTNKKKIFFCVLIVVIITVILMILWAAKK